MSPPSIFTSGFFPVLLVMFERNYCKFYEQMNIIIYSPANEYKIKHENQIERAEAHLKSVWTYVIMILKQCNSFKSDPDQLDIEKEVSSSPSSDEMEALKNFFKGINQHTFSSQDSHYFKDHICSS